MERSEISRHEVRVFQVLQDGRWHTARDLATAGEVAPRTARAHALKLARLNVVDAMQTFPGHSYRLSPHADKRNRGYVDRLAAAAEVYEIELAP